MGLPIRGAACLFSQALFSFTFMAVLLQQISHSSQSVLRGTPGSDWRPTAGYGISEKPGL